MGVVLGPVAVAAFVYGQLCFLRVVGLAVYGAFDGSGAAGLGLGDWNCSDRGAGR